MNAKTKETYEKIISLLNSEVSMEDFAYMRRVEFFQMLLKIVFFSFLFIFYLGWFLFSVSADKHLNWEGVVFTSLFVSILLVCVLCVIVIMGIPERPRRSPKEEENILAIAIKNRVSNIKNEIQKNIENSANEIIEEIVAICLKENLYPPVLIADSSNFPPYWQHNIESSVVRKDYKNKWKDILLKRVSLDMYHPMIENPKYDKDNNSTLLLLSILLSIVLYCSFIYYFLPINSYWESCLIVFLSFLPVQIIVSFFMIQNYLKHPNKLFASVLEGPSTYMLKEFLQDFLQGLFSRIIADKAIKKLKEIRDKELQPLLRQKQEEWRIAQRNNKQNEKQFLDEILEEQKKVFQSEKEKPKTKETLENLNKIVPEKQILPKITANKESIDKTERKPNPERDRAIEKQVYPEKEKLVPENPKKEQIVPELTATDINTITIQEKDSKGKHIVRTFRNIVPNYEAATIAKIGIGLAGELAVLAYEKDKLEAAGKGDLAKSIKHTSQVEGDGTGYDIQSFSVEGNRIFIEVKTTVSGIDSPLTFTRNEMAFGLGHPTSGYYLYRIYNYDKEKRTGELLILKGWNEIADFFDLKATGYRGVPR